MSDDTDDDRGWFTPARGGKSGEALSLIVGWCLAEPSRVGEVLLLTGKGPWILGRGQGEKGETRASLAIVRPGPVLHRPALSARGVSRKQLELRVDAVGALHVARLGKAWLGWNGRTVDHAILRGGDVISVEGQLVLLCVARPQKPFLASSDPPRFALGAPDAFGLVGESLAIWHLRDAIVFAASRREHALILGPSGTGKELVADAVHHSSPRAKAPLVARSAATFPPGLVDAELFGNARNYPNPGMPERRGLVGEADGGTLFLDELGEMPQEAQAHLLRVLDEGQYQRLGESETRRSDLRVLAATNRDASELKHDLAARLGLVIEVPGLEERREDIPLLARHLLREAAKGDSALVNRFFEADGEPRISPDLLVALVRATYTTHVRQLRSHLLVSIARSKGRYLDFVPELEDRLLPMEESDAKITLDRAAIEAALRDNRSSVSRAAAALGLKNRAVLYRLMKKHGLA